MFDDGGLILALAALFAAISLAVFAVASFVDVHDSIRRRLAGEPQHTINPKRGNARVSLRADSMRAGRERQSLESFLREPHRRAGRYIRSRLRKAGIADPLATGGFVLAQCLLAVAVPVAAFGIAPSWIAAMAGWQAVGLVLVLAGAGVALPDLWLGVWIRRRRREIGESLPDALDMMVVCVEAGLGLDAALARVGTQIVTVHPLLATELEQVSLELRAGKSRDEALRTFAARIDLPQVTSFVTLLVQSEALGASIAQTLRVHADDMRANRLLRAEEMAHKLPVKLTVPLVLCVLPAMLVAVLLPGMLMIVRTILPGLGH